MELNKLLKTMNIGRKDEELIEQILEGKHSYTIDYLPEILSNNKKYRELEVYYQKYLEDKNSEFIRFEEDLIRIATTLWAYDDVYIYTTLSSSDIKRNYYIKKNRRTLHFNKRQWKQLTCPKETIFRVCRRETLKRILLLGTRDICTVYLLFKTSVKILCIDGIRGYLYLQDDKELSKIKKIICTNRMYLY